MIKSMFFVLKINTYKIKSFDKSFQANAYVKFLWNQVIMPLKIKGPKYMAHVVRECLARPFQTKLILDAGIRSRCHFITSNMILI